MTRRAFLEAGRRDLTLTRRHRRPLACVMADVDHFKRVNNLHGHAMGDQVLRRLTSLLRSKLQAPDYAGRLAGEEFALILRDTDRKGALNIADRLGCLIAKEAFTTVNGPLKTTMSFGVAEFDQASSFDGLLEQADVALYQAKNSGWNRTVFYQPSAHHVDALSDRAPSRDFAERRPRSAPAHALNISAHFSRGAKQQPCNSTSYFNGVLQITADKAPNDIASERATVHGVAVGAVDGEAIWINDGSSC